MAGRWSPPTSAAFGTPFATRPPGFWSPDRTRATGRTPWPVLDDDPERLRMGARAAAHASGFSWDNTAAATLAAYALALDRSR